MYTYICLSVNGAHSFWEPRTTIWINMSPLQMGPMFPCFSRTRVAR